MSGPLKKLTGAARKKLGNHFGPLVAGSIALLCVWFSNGLWHGAAWHYVAFGLYHFVLILMGNIFAPYLKRVNDRLGLSSEKKLFHLWQMLRTTVLVIFGELIFRADSMSMAFTLLKNIFAHFDLTGFAYNDLKAALSAADCDVLDLLIVGITTGIVLVISILQEKGIRIRETLNEKPIAIRWAVWYTLILFVIIFGAYGVGYTPIDPMYANF